MPLGPGCRAALGGVILLALLVLTGCPPKPPIEGQPVRRAVIEPTATFPTTQPDEAISRRIGAAQTTIKTGASAEAVRQFLGTPTYQSGNQWTYVVEDADGQATATIRFSRGAVASVQSQWTVGWQRLADARRLVLPGAEPERVADALGMPDQKQDGMWWNYSLDEVAPSGIDLFFEDGNLSWGSWALLARLKKIDAQAPARLTRQDVRGILGAPLSEEPGAQWTYSALGGNARVFTRVYFRRDKVVAVHTWSEPVSR